MGQFRGFAEAMRFWSSVTALGLESQQVVALRMMKLVGGRDASGQEAALMVREKMEVAAGAAAGMMRGEDAAKSLGRYRRRVRANRRRLMREP